jgi:hypothetical protein
MNFNERGALLIFFALFRRTGLRLGNGDTALFRNQPHRIRERALFHFHDKTENVSALAAAEQ